MNDSRGFTLVEILVAIALVAGSLMTVAAVSLSSYERVHRSGQSTKALTLAQQQLEWLRSQPFDSSSLTAGTTTEGLTGEHDGYVRTVVVTDDLPRPGIKKVTVTVNTPAGRSLQLVSLLGGD